MRFHIRGDENVLDHAACQAWCGVVSYRASLQQLMPGKSECTACEQLNNEPIIKRQNELLPYMDVMDLCVCVNVCVVRKRIINRPGHTRTPSTATGPTSPPLACIAI